MSSEIDARGLACPQPVILTKKALDALAGGVVITIVDNPAARENVLKLAAASGCGACCEERNGCYHIRITKDAGSAADEPAACAAAAGGLVYLVGRDTMGHGSDELGATLIKSFFFTLCEASLLPRAILFVNGGVRLTAEGSRVLDHLQELAGRGVRIMSCGTCLDYYGLKERLAVGEVTNMYAIVAETAAAKTVTL